MIRNIVRNVSRQCRKGHHVTNFPQVGSFLSTQSAFQKQLHRMIQVGFSTQPGDKDPDNLGQNIIQNPPEVLQTVPQTSQILDKAFLTTEQQASKEEEYCLFSAIQPIYPYHKMTCQIKIGNLKHINNQLLYCMISPDNGEIFTVGIVLNKSVEVALKKQLKSNSGDDKLSANQQYSLDIVSRQSKYRVKLTEIRVTNDGIFAKAVPFKDRKLTAQEKQFNVEGYLTQIQKLMKDIQIIAAQDRVELFKDIDPRFLENMEQDKIENIDEYVYKVAMSMSTSFNQYLKESTSKFIQRLLETTTHIDRVILLKNQLQSFYDAMEIVQRNFKQAENSMYRLQAQQTAKLASEYIRQTYFRDQQSQQGGPPPPFNMGGPPPNGQGNQSYEGKSSSNANPLVKKYLDKLSFIEDPVSKDKIKKEIERFSQIDKHSSEFSKINQYLDEVFSVPWKLHTPVDWDPLFAKQTLDKEIYGLDRVKERIIEMISVNKLQNSDEKSKGFVLLLNGPPGTGKTSIAKTIAKCLKRTSRFISFAGVSDPHFFKGHRRTYVDSQPGVFVKELVKANTLNPVFILDEVDKISKSGSGGDPYYSLLEILNSEENHNFTDHYLDIAVDFSKVIFILTSNSTLSILEPLYNRLEIIEIPSYIEEEKVQDYLNFKLMICKEYIIPKTLESNGINKQLIVYDDLVIQKIIKGWCYYESGVREVKRMFEKIARKFAAEMVTSHPEMFDHEHVVKQIEEDPDKVEIVSRMSTEEDVLIKNRQSQQLIKNMQSLKPLDLTQDINLDLLQRYLGPPVFDAVAESRTNKIFPPGQVNILTVGGMIGNVMIVECCYDSTEIDKKGQFTSSGNLKNVLQESLKLAKINAGKYLKDEQLQIVQKSNIHVHFLSGGTPKDGPSAGTAICTALISLAKQYAVPTHVAMTGEISLNGNVCKIGGAQQKLIASKTLGISDVILPKGNLGEVLELPKLLLQGLDLYFVEKYDQIHTLIFEDRMKEIKEDPSINLDNIIVVRNGYITTTLTNSIYSNYTLEQQQVI